MIRTWDQQQQTAGSASNDAGPGGVNAAYDDNKKTPELTPCVLCGRSEPTYGRLHYHGPVTSNGVCRSCAEKVLEDGRCPFCRKRVLHLIKLC